MRYHLVIELRSELCCGTGESNGCTVDTLTEVDEYGFPMIPGKRIKGILRNIATEYLVGSTIAIENDDNIEKVTLDDINKIFGSIKGDEGGIRISNAIIYHSNPKKQKQNSAKYGDTHLEVIACYEKMKEEIDSLPESLRDIVTKNSITNHYVTYRSQTRMENFVAKEHSLRTTEVIKIGTTFIAEVDDLRVYDNNQLSKKYEKVLRDSVKLMRNIGMNRTRGFGEVTCRLEEINEKENSGLEDINEEVNCQEDRNKKINELSTNVVTRKYTIRLLSDIILNSNSGQVLDYIPGSMLLGALARYTNQETWFDDVILQNTIFSNAYISEKGHTYNPTPIAYVAEKNNHDYVVNRAVHPFFTGQTRLAEGNQTQSNEEGYESNDFDHKQWVNQSGYSRICDETETYMTKTVEKEIAYHHTKAKKNGPFRESSNLDDLDTAALFTMTKIKKGQEFQGFIRAREDALQLIEETLRNHQMKIYLGRSVTSQYASCEMVLEEEKKISGQAVSKKETNVETIMSDKKTVVIEFLSDLILIDNYGVNTTKKQELIKELKRIFQFEEKDCTMYSQTIVIGGYNSKWKLTKRQFYAFKRGATVRIEHCSRKEKADEKENECFLGAFQNEGFGQYRILTEDEMQLQEKKIATLEYTERKSQKDMTQNKRKLDISCSLIADIIYEQLKTRIKNKAMEEAENYSIKEYTNSNIMKFVALRDSDNMDEFKKNDQARKIKIYADDCYLSSSNEIIKQFYKNNTIDSTIKELVEEKRNELKREFFIAFSSQLKRKMQKGENK